MVDTASVNAWLERYVSAWKSYDKQAIGDLFSEDAVYLYTPFDQPLRGRGAIIASWLEQADSPGTYDAQYKPLIIQENTAVVNGRTQYFKADGKTLQREFDNLFIIRFDEQGSCTEFREWYMQRPKA